MSTHKHFDKICCVALVLTLLITVLFMNGENLGLQKASTVMKYESTLFDSSKVHTIDIVMDNWDEFIENCRSEEYYDCTVVINNESYKNVAIRGKGNTSLSSVTNDRYSFKIEFDHYDSTSTYHGLDKLVLNNVIQDNTYMKDYLTYTMMNDMGVASPFCSYAYITVNGEDWGLYLAVEGVEESFLQRNYGKDYGELYKPDSMSMGGGRGNGDKFDMDAFMQDFDKDSDETVTQPTVTTTETAESTTQSTTEATTESATTTTSQSNSGYPQMPEGMTPPEGGGDPFGGELPEDFTFPEGMEPPQGGANPFGGEMPEGFTFPEGMEPPQGGANPFMNSMYDGKATAVSNMSTKSTVESAAENAAENSSSRSSFFGGMTPPDGADIFGGEMPDFSQMPDMNGMPSMDFDIDEETVREAFRKLGLDESLLDGIDFDNISMNSIMSVLSSIDEDKLQELMQEIMGGSSGSSFNPGDIGGFGGFGGMGSSDVKLQYIDDDADSYSNIFGNAKTDITNADENRLIEALKKLSNGEELESTVDIEAVIRYFVVHNFVVNSDSYTGAMIHNYYLYEKDGQMQMIPWDYNLAFGSFMSMGTATSSVNDPIDTPLSVSGSGDRPMIDWIFSSEEYTELYHQIFNEFIEKYFDSGYFAEMIDSVRSMISPYVEKDPTKFCTYEEFEAGISTLKEFCLLRAESVKGQLDGTIGTTSATQKTETLIDAGDLNISSMGTMGGMGTGMSFPGTDSKRPQSSSDGDNTSDTGKPVTDEGDADKGNSGSRPQMPGGFQGGARPDSGDSAGKDGNETADTQTEKSDSSSRPDRGQSQYQPQSAVSASSLVMIGVSVLILGSGLLFALKYKRRR